MLKGFVFMFIKETGKNLFSLFLVRLRKGKNASSITRILQIQTTTEEIELTGWILSEKKIATSKNLYFDKKDLNCLTYSTSLDAQKLMIFGLQLCDYNNHKNCRGSWNLALMILRDTSTHNSHFMGISLSPHFVIILHGDINCLLNHFSCTKFNHLR